MKVLMMPNPLDADNLAASGITAVLRDYARHAPAADIEFVSEQADSFDVLAVHAGMSNFYTDAPYVAHCHGLYWTGDYKATAWEYKANRDVISSLRRANLITVPSEWVGLNLARDMHVQPLILPHAIDPSLWEARPIERKYILWNKNRDGDVCDPSAVRELALRFPAWHFISTFAPPRTPDNVLVTGPLIHSEMREVIMSAHVYLATTKETFGIGMLEARASGVPILAYREGGALGIVEHGVDGYLANPGDLEDLTRGLQYCLKYHDDLSQNALKNASRNTWPSVMRQLHTIYDMAVNRSKAVDKWGVSVVIPCYNYGHTLERAVESVMNQTLPPTLVVIVDDGSQDNTPQIADMLMARYEGVLQYIRTENRGVAHARNTGMAEVETRYACCLDADDEIAPEFLSVCVRALHRSPEMGLAYTRLLAIPQEGDSFVSEWPGTYNFDDFLKRKNQVPTCCVFRTDLFERAGGYRSRYAPTGAGSEDANLWLRMGALGYGGILASEEALFHYHLGGRVSSGNGYSEVDWLSPYAWTEDNIHPFASVASSKGLSHNVYQYDIPLVTVVIPCGASHLDTLWDALDSVEGQSFRRWEVIVVLDGIIPTDQVERLRAAYPYARIFHNNNEAQGAGWARNLGANNAQAAHLVFLDADDWLDIHCLDRMYREALSTGNIVYTDYIGHAFMDEAEARKLDKGNRLISYDTKTSMAEVRHFSADYDCALAQRQPKMAQDGSFYIWNIVTSMMPTKWHSEIGGFDEQMESWEDWDYWIRLAQKGKCFTRISEPLVHYRFYTGGRREIGRQQYTDLLDYMQQKYSEVELMPCSGCRGRTARIGSNHAVESVVPQSMRMGAMMAGEDMVNVVLLDGNMAKHPISLRDANNNVIKYGYRQHGEEFLMRRDHAEKYANKFKIVGTQEDMPQEDFVETPAPTPLSVFTSSERDKEEAQQERASKSNLAVADITRRKPGPKSKR